LVSARTVGGGPAGAALALLGAVALAVATAETVAVEAAVAVVPAWGAGGEASLQAAASDAAATIPRRT